MTQQEIILMELQAPQLVALKDLKLNEDNPRTCSESKFAKLVNSIKQFPEMLKLRPIIVNIDMVILGGNMRYRACVEAGLSEVPVLIAEDLTEAQQYEFIIKDNVGFGEWDFDTLANEWDALPLVEWGLDIPKQEPEEEQKDAAAGKGFKLIVSADDEEQQDIIYCKLIELGFEVQKK